MLNYLVLKELTSKRTHYLKAGIHGNESITHEAMLGNERVNTFYTRMFSISRPRGDDCHCGETCRTFLIDYRIK